MSISSIFGSPILLEPSSYVTTSFSDTTTKQSTPIVGGGGGGFGVGGLVIECSSRPRKKATAHHMKTRPRKTQPWDIKRKPTVYPPLPPLPPDFTIVSSDGNIVVDDASVTEVVVAPTDALQAPLTSG